MKPRLNSSSPGRFSIRTKNREKNQNKKKQQLPNNVAVAVPRLKNSYFGNRFSNKSQINYFKTLKTASKQVNEDKKLAFPFKHTSAHKNCNNRWIVCISKCSLKAATTSAAP